MQSHSSRSRDIFEHPCSERRCRLSLCAPEAESPWSPKGFRSISWFTVFDTRHSITLGATTCAFFVVRSVLRLNILLSSFPLEHASEPFLVGSSASGSVFHVSITAGKRLTRYSALDARWRPNAEIRHGCRQLEEPRNLLHALQAFQQDRQRSLQIFTAGCEWQRYPITR